MLLFVGLFLLLNYPLLKLANLPDRIAGIPRLYVYVFSVWMGAILALIFTIEFTPKRKQNPDKDE